jgi:hypothetical protein
MITIVHYYNSTPQHPLLLSVDPIVFMLPVGVHTTMEPHNYMHYVNTKRRSPYKLKKD